MPEPSLEDSEALKAKRAQTTQNRLRRSQERKARKALKPPKTRKTPTNRQKWKAKERLARRDQLAAEAADASQKGSEHPPERSP